MRPDAVADAVRELRRGPLHRAGAGVKAVDYRQPEIEQLVPHRPPFLLIESIDSISIERRTIRGALNLRATDPILAGHFPGAPVYPGVLQVEAVGQLGLCLLHFLATGAATIAKGARPASVRATRIHHALFQWPVIPGAPAAVLAGVLEEGGLTAVAAGQVYQGDRLCSLAIVEVYVAEDDGPQVNS